MRGNRNSCGWPKLFAVVVICALSSAGATAQTRDDAGLWFAVFGNGKFESHSEDSSLRWWYDSHYRLFDIAGGSLQSIIRPGLGYALDKTSTLWAGYAWIRTSPFDPGDEVDEHRFWQQWTATPSVGKWSFLHRSRFEQRWSESGSDVGLRWRQMARAQYVLTDCPQWSLIGWDEAFFHLNDTDWGTQAGFDQNRAFIGVGFKRSPEARIRLEIGYLNQFIYRRGGENGMNHLVSLNIFF